MRSSRSPASAAGISSTIMASASRLAGAERVAAATRAASPPTEMADVGDVEDRPPLQVDEVDDRAVQPAVATEQPVERGCRSPRRPPGRPRSATSGCAAAARPTGPARRSRRWRPTPMIGPSPPPRENAIPLLNARLSCSVQMTCDGPRRRARCSAQCLVSWSSDDDRRGDRQRRAARPLSPAAIAERPVAVVHRRRLHAHRRPIPPTFSSTSTVAHGIASRRSRGIGRPDVDGVAVGAVGEAHERGVDVGDGLAGLGRQGQVALALDDHRVALAALVVELRRRPSRRPRSASWPRPRGGSAWPVSDCFSARQQSRWVFRNLTSKSLV